MDMKCEDERIEVLTFKGAREKGKKEGALQVEGKEK